MKNPTIYLLILTLLPAAASAQSDPAVWNAIMKIEDNHYIINVPEGWKKVPLPDASPVDYKYDFTGVGIPALLNKSPLYANFTISHMKGNKTAQAMDQAIAEFTVFYDRVVDPGYNYDTTAAAVKTGENGTMLHTRYYRRSKVSNYSKYVLLIYNPKTDETYTLALNLQYKDASYDIERSARLREYAIAVFNHFEFR